MNLDKIVISTTLALLAGGCASAPPVVEEPAPETPTGPPITQPGDGYLMYYVDGTDIHVRETAAGVDSVILADVTDVRTSVSPDRRHVAMAYAREDSAMLAMIDVVSGRVSTIHSAPSGEYTMAWSGESDALGAAYRPTARGGRGAVFVADLDGAVRDVGCSASNRFVAWRSDGQVIVGDAANIYTVDVRGCRTLATLPRRDKAQIRYSPDGSRVLYQRSGGLIGARYDGSSSQWVARSRYEPGNARWSPDGRRIAFEVQSPRFGNITHLAIYEYATGIITVRDDEKPLGLPRDSNPCWSPSGDRISHDREYLRSAGGQDYVQKQNVVASSSGGDEVVVAEELIRDRQSVGVSGCGWIDDLHVALASIDGPRIYNVDTKVAYRLADTSRLLYARVVQR